MKNPKRPQNMLVMSLKVTFMLILADLFIFFILDSSKNSFTTKSLIAVAILFFVFSLKLITQMETNMESLKKEALYINFPVRIMFFLVIISLILLASSITLVCVNPSAANAAFIFTFFMSMVSMLMPSLLLLVYMFFIVPAFVIPSIKKRSQVSHIRMITILVLFLFILLCGYLSINKFDKTQNFYKQTDFKGSKLSLNYSTGYLQLSNKITPYAKKKMSVNTAKVPFFYLSEPIPYANYYDADRFCRALGAKVPNYLEAYHIVFNRFDTFGDKYYWTSDKDGDIPLVLHFKNMSFEIERLPENIKPELYCLISSEKDYEVRHKYTFHRNIDMESQEAIQAMSNKKFNINLLKDITKMDALDNKKTFNVPSSQMTINREKKHVSFSVKEVAPEYMNQLLRQGYAYNPSLVIQRQYEMTDATISSLVRNNTNNIRLCYYPFVEYGNMGISREKEIWKQSFCSPAFDIASTTPVLKSRQEKDSYCYSVGGRLPNIPELTGILKTLGTTQVGAKYWTNTKVKDSLTGSPMPVMVYFKDSRFMIPEIAQEGTNNQAYVYCVKRPASPSIVIANYKSRFLNEDGSIYAKQQCPNCKYYEIPDVIIQH